MEVTAPKGFTCLIGSRQKGIPTTVDRGVHTVFIPGGYVMSRMVQSLSGMFSDLREMGLQPFGTGFDSFRILHTKPFVCQSSKGDRSCRGTMRDSRMAPIWDQGESGHPQKGGPVGRRQGVRPVLGMESSRSRGLCPLWSWLLLSPALVCLFWPGDLCAVFVWSHSRDEDEPRGK